MCTDPSTRTVGLCHVISYLLFKGIDVNSQSSFSMLPAPISSFLQSIPTGRGAGDPAASSLALTKWKSLLAFLLHPNREDRSTLPTIADTRQQAIVFVKALNNYLSPFVPTGETSRLQ